MKVRAVRGCSGDNSFRFRRIDTRRFFDLSREAIASDTAYVRRQYIYNALAVIATQCAYLLALRLMPDQKRDAREKFTQYLRSRPTAIASAAMVTFAVVWGMGTTLAALACPCSRILGGNGCPDTGCAAR